MGATHLGIALANYCRSFHHAKTALLELNDTGNLKHLQDFESQSCFSIYGVDYYPAVSLEQLPYFFNMDYHFFILDFGILEREHFQDFLRCDRKLVIGSLSPWKRCCFENFLSNWNFETQQVGNVVYLALFGTKSDLFEFSCKHRLLIRAIPFIANPFELSKNLFSFLESLI